ncbi:MAG: small multi-drug export protein [Candidatus Aenigmarchaeota archaeon]|nr:small multi-drug export protein [Candidatus Aenigmarchaeota archaeon]
MKIYEHVKREIRLIRAKESKKEILLKLTLPFIISALVVFGLWLSGTDIYLKFIYIAGVYLFTPIGMLAGLPFAIGIKTSIWKAILFMVFSDAMASLWIVWNLDLLKVVPFLGNLVEKSQAQGKRYLERNPKLRNFAFIGLITFVLIPLYGSGSILGSIIGKMISMKEYKIVIAVVIGSIIRLTIMGLIAQGLLLL